MHKSLFEPTSNPTCILYKQFGIQYVKNHLKVWSLNSPLTNPINPSIEFKLIGLQMNHFDVYKLVVNQDESKIALVGKYEVWWIRAPTASDLFKPDSTPLIKAYKVGGEYHSEDEEASKIVQVKWHPLSLYNDHLVTLTHDGILRMFNVTLNNDKSELTYDLIADDMKLIGKKQRKANLGFGTKTLETKFVGFCFGKGEGWEQFTLLLFTVSGKPFLICPFVPKLARLNRVALEALVVEFKLSNQNNSMMESWLKELLIQCQDNLNSNTDLETNSDLTEVSIHLHHPIFTIAPMLQGPIKFTPPLVSDKLSLPQSIHWIQGPTVDIIALTYQNARVEAFIPLKNVVPQWIEQDRLSDSDQWQLCGLEGFNLQDARYPEINQPLTTIHVEDGLIFKHLTAIYHWDVASWFNSLQNSLNSESNSESSTLTTDFIANITSGTHGMFILNNPAQSDFQSSTQCLATHNKLLLLNEDGVITYEFTPKASVNTCLNKSNIKNSVRQIKSYLKTSHLPQEPFTPSEIFTKALPNCPNLQSSQTNESIMKSFETHYESLLNQLIQLQKDQLTTNYRWELIDLEYNRQLKLFQFIQTEIINRIIEMNQNEELNEKIQRAKLMDEGLKQKITNCLKKKNELILLETKYPLQQFDTLLANFHDQKETIQRKMVDFKSSLEFIKSQPKLSTLSDELIQRVDAISNHQYELERQLYGQNELINKTKYKLQLSTEKLNLLEFGKIDELN